MPTTDDQVQTEYLDACELKIACMVSNGSLMCQVRQLWKSVLMNKGDELWPEGPHAKLFENPVAKKEGLFKIINRHKQSGVDLPRYI